jgi:CRISPR system Cascade subunit CasD
MATLLMCLAGPMQSWGTRSRFSDRDTERFPSKSGVLGLACAALGWQRDAAAFEGWTMADLAALALGAREDLPGRLATDYHVTQDVPTADGSGSRTIPSQRHYLADAAFLVGLEGDPALLERIGSALARPVWPLCLGRKSFAPGVPVRLADGWRDESLAQALATHPWLPDGPLFGARRQPPDQLWLELEDPAGQPRQDVPLGPFGQRRFGVRRVRYEPVATPRRKEVTACAST